VAAISLVPPASLRRSRPHALAEQSSNHGDRHTHAWPVFASRESADHSSKRAHTALREMFSAVFSSVAKNVVKSWFLRRPFYAGEPDRCSRDRCRKSG